MSQIPPQCKVLKSDPNDAKTIICYGTIDFATEDVFNSETEEIILFDFPCTIPRYDFETEELKINKDTKVITKHAKP